MNAAQAALDTELSACAGIIGEQHRACKPLRLARAANKAGDALVVVERIGMALREAGSASNAYERLKSCEVMALQIASAPATAAKPAKPRAGKRA